MSGARVLPFSVWDAALRVVYGEGAKLPAPDYGMELISLALVPCRVSVLCPGGVALQSTWRRRLVTIGDGDAVAKMNGLCRFNLSLKAKRILRRAGLYLLASNLYRAQPCFGLSPERSSVSARGVRNRRGGRA